MMTQSKMPNILIIYQGQNAKQYLNDITVYMTTKLKPKPNVIHLDDGDNSFDQIIYKKYLKLVAECDAAIALITPDRRRASNAGNVWLELGIWLALKPEGSLLVLRHKEVRKFPSDIIGGILPDFEHIKDIKDVIQGFVQKIATRINQDREHSNSGFGKTHKVMDIFWRKAMNPEEVNALFNCVQNNNRCLRTEKLLCLGSELMQLRSIFWELHLIQYSLFRIAYSIDMIETNCCFNGSMNNHGMELNKKVHVPEIIKAINVLDDLSKKYMANVRWRYGDAIHPMDRLMHFLEHRLKDAEKISSGDLIDNGVGASFAFLHRGVKEFTEWAHEVSNDWDKLSSCAENSSKVNLLADRKKFCINMATILNILVQRDYKECFEIMNEEFGKVENSCAAYASISSIIERFPHNNAEKPAVRIWPQNNVN